MPEAMLSHEAMVALLGLAGRCCPNSIETAELVCQVHFSTALVGARMPFPPLTSDGRQASGSAANDVTCASAMSRATFIGATSRAVCASR